MAELTCTIDGAALERLSGVLERVQRESPKTLATETRRAAIYICQSLRARTKKAPKRARQKEMLAVPSPIPPRYIHSHANGQLLRRWQLTRKVGTPDQYTRQHYVYTNAHRGRNGQMVGKSAAAERRELFRLHGGISRSGLAKKSWGWIMRQIHSGADAGDLSWQRRKGERRDPRQAVKGMFERFTTGAAAQIRNALDYIAAALFPGALPEAIDAAAKRLEFNISKTIERATQ